MIAANLALLGYLAYALIQTAVVMRLDEMAPRNFNTAIVLTAFAPIVTFIWCIGLIHLRLKGMDE